MRNTRSRNALAVLAVTAAASVGATGSTGVASAAKARSASAPSAVSAATFSAPAGTSERRRRIGAGATGDGATQAFCDQMAEEINWALEREMYVLAASTADYAMRYGCFLYVA